MTHSSEIHTSVAMLISVFGDPARADHEANSYEWHIELADGSKVHLRNLSTGGSAARVQPWELSSDTEAGIAQINAKLEEGENYYEGGLHPELFIKRDA
tara:strand:- start:597 stop:893 length:297 start_codon:yes stop_codon:yes gene_type:complete